MDLIKENTEVVKELMSINKTLLKQLSHILYKLNNKVNKTEINKFPALGFNYISERYSLLDDFLDFSDVKVQLYYKDGKEGGSFIPSNKLIVLFLSDKFISEFNSINKENKLDIFNLVNKFLSSILIHELQHSYDNYRSKGKAFNNKQQQNYQKLITKKFDNWVDKNKAWNTYINLDTEIWARLIETIPQLVFYNNDKKNSFIDIIKEFKSKFQFWNELEEKKKKRLIKFIYKFYQNI